jgi:antirestriction protein ArdC
MTNRDGRADKGERAAADAARAARIAALHRQIGERVSELCADPAWQAMLDTAARFHSYSLNNQLLITAQAVAQGFTATRVAGFTTWKTLGRSVVKGAKGIAVLAPCTYRTKTRTEPDTRGPGTADPGAAEETSPATNRPDETRALRGFRVVHVFDISQTEGEPLPEVRPQLLTGDAPTVLWKALAAQVTGHGYTLTREHCGDANGLTDPATRTVRIRPDIAGAQSVKTLAHELAHIECGHTTDGFDYLGCRGRAEAEAESVAYIVTAWTGLDSTAYTVPYVAGWSRGDLAVLRTAAGTVTAAAGRILARLDGDDEDDPEPASPAVSDTSGVLLVAA